MVQECGKVRMEILTLANGKMEKQKDMEFTLGLMEIDMKDNLNNV